MATNIDALVVDDYLMIKDEQKNAGQVDAAAHLAKFQLD